MLDVTRCKIETPSDMPWEYYSFKDKFHALKFEVAIRYKDPRIIWVSDAYKGAVSDITIAREEFKGKQDPGELALADLGYMGENDHFLVPYKGPKDKYGREVNYVIQRKRQEIERITQRIKNFSCFRQEWRGHDYDFHQKCLCQCARLLIFYWKMNHFVDINKFCQNQPCNGSTAAPLNDDEQRAMATMKVLLYKGI